MAPGKRNLKATKKFEKKHLTGVLDKRKAGAKVKQRQQMLDKKKQRRAKDAESISANKEDEAKKPAAKGKKVNEMSVDDFFNGGFDEIIEDKKAGKSGKRKRDGRAAEDNEADSDDSMGEQPVANDSDDNEDDGEDLGMSKKTMDELAEKDPEFYKFLKENDPEVLDFDDNADLAEVDALSGDDEDEQEEEQPKKKKQKKDKKAEAVAQGNELTRELVASWKKAMADRHSLRAARQVVLAFRCAAHLNEDDDEESNPSAINSMYS